MFWILINFCRKKQLGTGGSVTMIMCECRSAVSPFRLRLLMSSWEVRIRERWRHSLISVLLLECWLLTSDLSHTTPPSSSWTACNWFKGLPGGLSGAIGKTWGVGGTIRRHQGCDGSPLGWACPLRCIADGPAPHLHMVPLYTMNPMLYSHHRLHAEYWIADHIIYYYILLYFFEFECRYF